MSKDQQRAGPSLAIPAIDHGLLDDAAAFEITFVENYQRQDLTPLEGAKAAAILLDRHGGDVKATAAKLGRSERWVQLHAQIERGLSPEWRQAAATERFREWPAAQLELYLVNDRLPLAKAPFDTSLCAQCLNRTGVQPLLWSDQPAELEGANDRCLDRQCWEKKEAQAAKAAFAEQVRRHNYPGAVPISLVEKAVGYDPGYPDTIRLAKRAFGKQLVTRERIEICKGKTAKGAVPAIVVAGRGKGSLKWVRIVEPQTDEYGHKVAKPPTPAEIERQKREKANADRKAQVISEIAREIAKAKRPESFEDLLFCCSVTDWPWSCDWRVDWPKRVEARTKAYRGGRLHDVLAKELETALGDWLRGREHYVEPRRHWPSIRAIAPVFGIDADKRLADRAKAAAAQDKTETAEVTKRAKKRPGKRGKK